MDLMNRKPSLFAEIDKKVNAETAWEVFDRPLLADQIKSFAEERGLTDEDEKEPEKRLLGEVNGMGKSITVDTDGGILVEPYSHTIGADPFSYNVEYQFYDSNGELVPNLVPLNAFGNATSAFSGKAVTGQGGGIPDLIFTSPQPSGNYYNGRVQWRVTIPRQFVTHQNSMGWNLRVYAVP